VQDARRGDLIHREFDAVLLRDLMSHHVLVDLHGDVVNSDLMAFADHLRMGGVHQIELVALLALNC
jgi:hypothetical protein